MYILISVRVCEIMEEIFLEENKINIKLKKKLKKEKGRGKKKMYTICQHQKKIKKKGKQRATYYIR